VLGLFSRNPSSTSDFAYSYLFFSSVVCHLSVVCHPRALCLNCLTDLCIWQILFMVQWHSVFTGGLELPRGRLRTPSSALATYDSPGGSTDQQFWLLQNHFLIVDLFSRCIDIVMRSCSICTMKAVCILRVIWWKFV